jgi:hypothetical protein
MTIDAGFLIVCPFELLYEQFSTPHPGPLYAVPQIGVPSSAVAKRYRGIDREASKPGAERTLTSASLTFRHRRPDHAACVLMENLRERGRSDDDFILDRDSAAEVWSRLQNQDQWEAVWARRLDAERRPPDGAVLLGYEPTWFIGDHFSAVADSMCFPWWHGCDSAGTLFLPFFERLNRNALFDTSDEASDFLAFYRSHDWTESGEYSIAEVWGVSWNGVTPRP